MENENKRFKYVEFTKYMLSFEDNGVCKFFHEKDFEDWLNELHEEKELLKKELSEQGTQLDFLKDENIHMRNVLNENEQLKQQMQRLYNYFADWFDDIMPQSNFSEMWDGVKEDEE